MYHMHGHQAHFMRKFPKVVKMDHLRTATHLLNKARPVIDLLPYGNLINQASGILEKLV